VELKTLKNMQLCLSGFVILWIGSCPGYAAPEKTSKSKKPTTAEATSELKTGQKRTGRLADVLPVAAPLAFFSPGNRLLFPNPAQIYRISRAATQFSASYGKFTWQYDSDYYDAKVGFRDEGYRLFSVLALPGFPLRLGFDYSKSLSYQTTEAEIRNRITGNTAVSTSQRFAETSRPRFLVGFPLVKNVYGGLGLETGARSEKAQGETGSVSFSAIDAGVVLTTQSLEAGISYIPGIDEEDGEAAFSQVGQTVFHATYFVGPLIAAEATVIWNRWKEGADDETKDAPELGVGASAHGNSARGTVMLDYGPNFRKNGEFSWMGVMIDGRISIGPTVGIGSTLEYRRVKLRFDGDDSDGAVYKNPNSYSMSLRGEYLL